MRRLNSFVIIAVMIGVLSALANPVSVEWQDTRQDPLMLPSEQMDELGDFFPADELIVSQEVPWEGHIPCPTDYQETGCVEVEITNHTLTDFTDVHYVADPETFLTNDDGLIGNIGMNDLQLAFRIDSVGANTPLVFESMLPDNVFQAGETWRFVIQEFSNTLGGTPAPFDSLGIASMSTGWVPSTGSIIAIPEPNAIVMILMSSGGLIFIRRKFMM